LTPGQIPDLDDIPGEEFAIPGLPGFISTAEAIVGRPLTPMSAAGVARRTSRRCAAGPYC